MGLDMYLSATKHVSGFSNDDTTQYDSLLSIMGLKRGDVSTDVPSASVGVTVAYWRKANAIHAWFVDNCQDGKDECQSSYVSREQLSDLASLCEKVSKHPKKAEELLATRGGFFFGSTDYDKYFFKEIRDTAKTLRKVLDNPKYEGCSFEYRASW